MRKTAKKLASISLALCMGLPMVACGGGVGGHEGVCEVQAILAGYGTDWLEESVKVFNEMYKQEGYKVEITLIDTATRLGSEILTPKRNTTDLYFDYTEQIKTAIDKSRSILGKDGGALLEDLTDVYEAKAVGVDKKEQGGAIKERINDYDIQLNRYTGTSKGYDGIYGFPWYGGAVGMYVNKKVLTEKGYNLDSFLTTDGVIEVSKALAPSTADKSHLNANNFFPVAWTGVSSGYWAYWTQTLLAQYLGEKEYKDFYNFIPEGGEEQWIQSGWSVYQDRGIYEVLHVTEQLLDRDLAAPGTVSYDMIASQVRLMDGKALFMVSGDWIYKEMERDYEEYLDDVIPIKSPIISSLGVKLGLCGTTHPEPAYPDNQADFVEEYSCAQCEAKLRSVIKAVDAQNKADAQIATELGVTEEQVSIVRERRGYYEDAGGFSVVMPSYSDQKEVGKLFLRFLCSDDAIAIYRKEARANLKVKPINALDLDTLSETEQIMYEKMYGKDAHAIYSKTDNLVRIINGVNLYPGGGTTRGTFLNMSYSHSGTSKPMSTAKSIYFDSVKIVKGNWKDWLKNANYIV